MALQPTIACRKETTDHGYLCLYRRISFRQLEWHDESEQLGPQSGDAYGSASVGRSRSI